MSAGGCMRCGGKCRGHGDENAILILETIACWICGRPATFATTGDATAWRNTCSRHLALAVREECGASNDPNFMARVVWLESPALKEQPE